MTTPRRTVTAEEIRNWDGESSLATTDAVYIREEHPEDAQLWEELDAILQNNDHDGRRYVH